MKIILSCFFFCLHVLVWAQDNSYSFRILTGNETYHLRDCLVNSEGRVFLILTRDMNSTLAFVQQISIVEVVDGGSYGVDLKNSLGTVIGEYIKSELVEGKIFVYLFNLHSGIDIYVYDISNGFEQKITHLGYNIDVEFISEKSYYILKVRPGKVMLASTHLDSAYFVNHQFRVQLLDSVYKVGSIRQHVLYSMNHGVYAAAVYGNEAITTIDLSKYHSTVLFKFDTLVSLKRVIRIDGFKAVKLVNHPDGIYCIGKTGVFKQITGNESDLMLIHFDKNLNVVFMKLYFGDQFEYSKSDLIRISDNRLLLTYSTFGAFPVVLAELDANGNILSQAGFNAIDPIVKIAPDGSLIMAGSKIIEDNGAVVGQGYVVKSDSEGFIENCSEYTTCIKELDESLQVIELYAEDSSFYDIPIDPWPVTVDSTLFGFTPYCSSLPAPSPAFTVPAKMCLLDTLHALGNNNALAHGVEWHLTGPGVDSVLTDSLGFRYVPAEPGTYTLEQTIWYLGCAYSEAHEVEVLPALELHIVPEGPSCSPPFRLGLEASRPLQQVQWAHGPTAASITAQNQGWYIAHATDGTCTATDSLEVVFVDSLLAGAPALGLPPDTTVCVQDLPFVLEVTSPLADSFLLNGVREEAPLPLPEGDTYTVSACIRGCCYSETYHLDTYDCAPRIYMPTAISPNGDGINDELFAQGKNFSTLRLKVFHRWGGLLHSAEGPDARWDAHDAPAGTYVWLLEYRSHYDGSIQRISGEVTVLR